MTGKTLNSLETWSPADNAFNKSILKSGSGEQTPNDGSVCILELNLIDLEDVPDDMLGGYKLNQECEITIGEGDTVLSELFDRIVTSMKAGEQGYIKCTVDIYGNKIDKFQSDTKRLKCKISLKSFSRSADPSELLADEKLERAEHHKNRGTSIYSGNLKFSLLRFSKALFYMNDIDIKCLSSTQAKYLKTLKLQCHLNVAAGNLKEQRYEDVIEHCKVALTMDPKNVKGLFRRAQAHLKLHQYQESKIDLLEALQQDEQNKAVRNQLQLVEDYIRKEKQMYRKMFE